MTIDELERDGWEIIDTFGYNSFIIGRNHQRMVVDNDGNIVIVY
jgi:hypothetical protein